MGIRHIFRKTWVRVGAALLGLLLVLVLVVGGLFFYLFMPSMPAADFATPASAADAYRQDLSYLADWVAREKAFDDASRLAAVESYLAEAKDNLVGMTSARFELVVARAAALADNGHTNVSPIGRTRRVNHLPIRSGPFEDGEFVLQATREHADLLGAEILAIERHPTSDVATAFLKYFGGAEQRARLFTHLLINSPELLHAEGFTRTADGATISFRLQDGAVEDRYLRSIPANADRTEPYGRAVMDYRVPEEDADNWLHLMAGQRPPLSLAEPDEPYLYRRLEKHNGCYVKINFNWDIGGRSLTGWLEEVAADMTINTCAFATIDLRFNGGGTDATASFARALPALVAADGPIYVIVSRETFSAGIGAAAQIVKFAGDRAHIVGGQVGDRLRFVANGGDPVVLPNSGIPLRLWSSWEDYADGCWAWSECFWFSPFFRREGVVNLDPDIRVPVNFRDYVQNRDAAMEAILEDVDGQNAW